MGRVRSAFTSCALNQSWGLISPRDNRLRRMKRSGEQYDERIVECAWDPERDSWRFMRFRDDKHDGNFIDIVDKIIDSIKDGVELHQVCFLPLLQIRCGSHADEGCGVAADRTMSDNTSGTERTSSTSSQSTAPAGVSTPAAAGCPGRRVDGWRVWDGAPDGRVWRGSSGWRVETIDGGIRRLYSA